MGIEEGLNIERRIVKTRMPFRVTAFLLGILFVAIGLFQLLGGATDWIAFGFAIFAVKIGLQFVYSALTQQWKSPFEWTRRETVKQIPARFLIVEPVSLGITEIKIRYNSDSPEQAINPYAPPRNLSTTSVAHGTPYHEETLQDLAQQFLDGHPFIHYGVVFFLDTNDDLVIHAALPLASSCDVLVRRNMNEAMRVLPEFLSTLPNASPVVIGRNLVVRMISSYDHLDDEVCDRIVIPWAVIIASSGEQANAHKQRS